MKRPVNFRPFLLAAVCAVTVTLCVVLLPDPYAAVTGIVVTALLLLVAAMLGLNGKPVACVAFSISFIVAVSCFVTITVTKYNWKSELKADESYYLIGTIETKTLTNDGAAYLLRDVTANGERVTGKLRVSVTDDDVATVTFLERGDRIGVSTDVRFTEFNAKNSAAVRNDIKYYAIVDASELSFIGAEPGFFDNLRNEMSDALDKNLNEYGQIAFGMITGDKGSIDNTVTDYYSVSGIGHILSVSGLHVGFVVAIAAFILDRLRANRLVKLGVIAVALTLYCFLASFALSVVRASIMCILGLIAGSIGKQRDPLSGLCFAVTVILAVQPVSLFDVGFEMSVAAVLGILLFAKSFTRVFSRFLPKPIASALAVSLSAQIGITPVSLVYFNAFPTYSVFVNLLVIPIVTVAFIAIVLALTITLLIPQAGILLSVAGIPLVLVDDIALFVCKLPLAELRIFATGLLFAVFVLYFVCSQFFMMPKFKPIVIAVCVLAASCCVSVMNIPLDKSYDIVTTSEYKSVNTIVRSNDKTYIIGDLANYKYVDEALRTMKVRTIDAVYLNDLDKSAAGSVLSLSRKYKIKAVYFPFGDDSKGMIALASGGFTRIYPLEQSVNDEITPLYSEENFTGYVYDSGTVKVLLLGYGVKAGKLPTDAINECAIIRAYVYDGNYGKRIYLLNYDNDYVYDKPEFYEVLSGKIVGFKTADGTVKTL